jgi:hypothetical protein
MSGGTGTGTAKGFTPATPEQVKHLLETHLRIFIDETKDEVYISYGLNCDDGKCPFPGKPVTYRMCPTVPCNP